jgi:hypothetical protein
MRSRPTEVSWFCNILITPSRCPVPSKCHQISARRKDFCTFQNPFLRGIAENYRQSSTWPTNLLSFSTMHYKEYGNHLQGKVDCLPRIYLSEWTDSLVTNVKNVSYIGFAASSSAATSFFNFLCLQQLTLKQAHPRWQPSCTFTDL